MTDLRFERDGKKKGYWGTEYAQWFKQIGARLKNGKVSKVAVSYSLVMWFGIQLCDVVFPMFKVSETAMVQLAMIGVGGLPVAMLMAWFFELVPVRTTPDASDTEDANSLGRVNLIVNVFFIVSSILLAGFVVLKVASQEAFSKHEVRLQLQTTELPSARITSVDVNSASKSHPEKIEN